MVQFIEITYVAGEIGKESKADTFFCDGIHKTTVNTSLIKNVEDVEFDKTDSNHRDWDIPHPYQIPARITLTNGEIYYAASTADQINGGIAKEGNLEKIPSHLSDKATPVPAAGYSWARKPQRIIAKLG